MVWGPQQVLAWAQAMGCSWGTMRLSVALARVHLQQSKAPVSSYDYFAAACDAAWPCMHLQGLQAGLPFRQEPALNVHALFVGTR